MYSNNIFRYRYLLPCKGNIVKYCSRLCTYFKRWYDIATKPHPVCNPELHRHSSCGFICMHRKWRDHKVILCFNFKTLIIGYTLHTNYGNTLFSQIIQCLMKNFPTRDGRLACTSLCSSHLSLSARFSGPHSSSGLKDCFSFLEYKNVYQYYYNAATILGFSKWWLTFINPSSDFCWNIPCSANSGSIDKATTTSSQPQTMKKHQHVLPSLLLTLYNFLMGNQLTNCNLWVRLIIVLQTFTSGQIVN